MDNKHNSFLATLEVPQSKTFLGSGEDMSRRKIENLKRIKMIKKVGEIEIIEDDEHDPLRLRLVPEDPVQNSFKWMLMLGRLIGVSPISVGFQSSGATLTFRQNLSRKLLIMKRWRSLSSAHTILLSSLMFLILTTQLWRYYAKDRGPNSNILDELSHLHSPMYRFTVFAVFFYWLRYSQGLLQLFNRWLTTMKKLNFETKDDGFPKFCMGITLILLGTCMAENTLGDFYYIQKGGKSLDGVGLMEKIYKHNLSALSRYWPAPSHFCSLVTVVLIIGERFSIYAFNFADVLVIIMCRALAHTFKQVNDELQVKLGEFREENRPSMIIGDGTGETMKLYNSQPQPSFQISVLGRTCKFDSDDDDDGKEQFWRGFRSKILALCSLAEEVTRFVGPLVWACYFYSIFFIILNSLRLLYESNTGTSPYVYVSTIQFAMRVILVTYHASQVYHSTEGIVKTLDRNPDMISSPTAYGLERMLTRHPVGVILFGTVPVTRNVFISIMSFLFTAEIVLLQAMSTTAKDGNNSEVVEHACNCNCT